MSLLGIGDKLFGTQPLLLDMLLLLLPIFIYQFIVDKTPFHRMERPYSLIGWLSAPATLLCMIFPFSTTTGCYYDLRALPIYISVLYAGPRAGILSYALFVMYRYYLGGHGFYVALFCLTPAVLIAMAVSKSFHTYAWSKKRNLAIGLVIVGNLVRIPATFVFGNGSPLYLHLSLVFCIISVCMMWVCVYLIEAIGENLKMRHELARSDKLQVVSDLAASIAHEIRNPMTTARGFAQLLQQDSATTAKHQTHLSLVIHELDRAQEIITDYLSFARPQLETIQPIDVSRQIRQVISLLSPFASSHLVCIREEVDHGALRVVGNEAKLRQALVNILKNAIESMTEGGTIRVSSSMHNDNVVIRVTDTGIGMTKADLGHLGTPFYSTKTTGTGLGLMVTYQIIEKLNGKIEVDSAIGMGTTFVITLPSVMDELGSTHLIKQRM
jgi:two-component system sporulation sensor kinase B